MASAPPPGEGAAAIAKVWDAPVRLVHWTMVFLFAFSWWSVENHEMDWHRLSGLTLLGLLVFRVLWGFFGGSTARFSSFVRGPGAVIRYARALVGKGEGEAYHGHNPLGGLSVMAMLLLLVAQVSFGLFAVDVDGLESGPLSTYVSFDTGRAAAKVHETIFDLLLIVIGLHVVAVFSYLIFKRENLIGAMFTGRRRGEGDPLRGAPIWVFALIAIIAAAVAWWLAKGASPPFGG